MNNTGLKKYLFLQLPLGYFNFFAWVTLVAIMLVSLTTHPLHAAMTGDEPYYLGEMDYFLHYGLYESVSQGSSFGFTEIIFVLSKIIHASPFVIMKLFSASCYLGCCFMLLKILMHFKDISIETCYLGMVFFAYNSRGFIWRALPDMPHALVIFIALFILISRINYKSIAVTGLLVFTAFIIKPIAVFFIPAILAYLFFNKTFVLKQRIIQMILFIGVFSCFFGASRIPGYQAHGEIMLEDKNHLYDGKERVPNAIAWDEINIYYAVYNPNHRENKWHVDMDELNKFKKENPGKLDLSYVQFIQQHTNVWTTKIVQYLFLELPYYIDGGLFYHKWTIINNWIKNIMLLKFISLIFFIFFCYKERDFIRKNTFLIIPAIYYLLLSLYVIPQLEENWLIPCLPFLALPVYRFLLRKIGSNIVLLGQLLVVFL